MNYLLDTCVISEIVRPSPEKKVIEWINITPDERLFLCVVTVGEIHKGLSKLPESKKKNLLANWLNTLLVDYQNRIYPIDLTVAENWGIILGRAEKAGSPVAAIDGLIAAIARTHNLILVTRNESDFAGCGITTLNPWATCPD